MTHRFWSTHGGYIMFGYVEVEAETPLAAADVIACKTNGVVVEEPMRLYVKNTADESGWEYDRSHKEVTWEYAIKVEVDNLRPPAPFSWGDGRV